MFILGSNIIQYVQELMGLVFGNGQIFRSEPASIFFIRDYLNQIGKIPLLLICRTVF